MSKLKELRKTVGLSQSELAKISGLAVRTLQNYEQEVDDINGMGIKRAKALADALGCRIENLIEDENEYE